MFASCECCVVVR